MKLNPEELKSLIKSRVRVYFITMDFLLQKLRDEGVFQKYAFNPIAGKIDPYDPDNFNCQPRIFKKEKIVEFSHNAISKYKMTNKIGIDRESAIGVMDAITKEIFKGIDNSYRDLQGVNYAKFSMFSFFNLSMDFDEKSGISENQKQKILRFLSNVEDSPFMDENSFKDTIEKSTFEGILANPEFCISTLTFSFMDLTTSVLGGFTYNIKDGDIALIGDKASVYNSLTFLHGEGYKTDKYKVADILPIEESSINLLDL